MREAPVVLRVETATLQAKLNSHTGDNEPLQPDTETSPGAGEQSETQQSPEEETLRPSRVCVCVWLFV